MDSKTTTKLGKEIISAELVGQNISYSVLRAPAKPAYPRGDEVRYSDDFLARINDLYSLDELLGSHREGIKTGRWADLDHFTMGSPLQNSEGERILNGVLYNSAHAGLWQPYIIDVPQLTDTSIRTAREYLKEVNNVNLTPRFGRIDEGVLFGLAVAEKGKLVLPIEYDNKVIVAPSQAFVEYVAQRK